MFLHCTVLVHGSEENGGSLTHSQLKTEFICLFIPPRPSNTLKPPPLSSSLLGNVGTSRSSTTSSISEFWRIRLVPLMFHSKVSLISSRCQKTLKKHYQDPCPEQREFERSKYLQRRYISRASSTYFSASLSDPVIAISHLSDGQTARSCRMRVRRNFDFKLGSSVSYLKRHARAAWRRR